MAADLKPLFANLFAASANSYVVQVVFKNQAEPEGAVEPIAHVVMSASDARALAKALMELTGGEGVQ